MNEVQLNQRVTFDGMLRLGTATTTWPDSYFDQDTLEGVEELGELERVQRASTTPASAFAGRDGYNPSFLTGFVIPLPQPIAGGARDGDLANFANGSETELKYRHFSTLQSRSRRMPMLTATNIDGSASRRLPRADNWRFDGRLALGDQWGDEIYNNNALDRGHMVRREDPIWGSVADATQANLDTFHFTNSCPQMAGVNQQTWLGLENYVLQHARTDEMRVSVFTGPYFSDDDLQYRNALIPLAFWKVVAVVLEDGRPSVTAYKVSQERELGELEFVYGGYKTYQISLASVIQDTALDFSALLPYDGFSEHESVTGAPLTRALRSLESVMI